MFIFYNNYSFHEVIKSHLADGSLDRRHKTGSGNGEGALFKGDTSFWHFHIK